MKKIFISYISQDKLRNAVIDIEDINIQDTKDIEKLQKIIEKSEWVKDVKIISMCSLPII